MKKFVVSGLCLFVFGFANAAHVDVLTAKNLARNFWFSKASALQTVKYSDVSVREVISETTGGEAMLYAVNIDNGGFVLIAADDIVYPFLGYSFEGFYSRDNQSPEFLYWIEHYKREINYNKTKGASADAEIVSAWQKYMTVGSPDIKDSKAVTPLCLSTWNQNAAYNLYCPVDAAGPGGRAYAGCVATAMAQIMYYYRWPLQGTGTHNYISEYGSLSVNPGATTYDWNGMVNSVSGVNAPVNTLIYHCGVTVNMDYSATGSGAQTSNAATAMASHFKYSNTISDESKSDYSEANWTALLRANLDAMHPILYSGYDVGGNGGHAWVCDGYQGTDFFHMNWGWGGSANGYFYLNNLNAPGYNFTDWQGAVVNAFPVTTSYPVNCTGTTTVTGMIGTIADGSGPSNYQNNNDCKWLISPGAIVDKITLTFNQFDTESGNDLVTVYDGNSTSSPVLATYSGSTLPAAVSSTGSEMLVHFTSNGSTNATGWLASYQAFLPVYCSGVVQQLTAAGGSFTDGSGTNNYNANSNCKWQIIPVGATSITLNFTDFNTESGVDMVKVYNSSSVPTVLLGTFSGSTIPAQVSCNCSQMMVMFNSNATNQFAGFTGVYNSLVGIEETNELTPSIYVYPVPAIKSFTLSIDVPVTSNVEINIVDLLGKPVYKEIMRNASGSNQKVIDVSSLAEGIYFVKVSIGKDIFTKKMIVQH